MGSRRPRLSYANVVSTVALFVALGGTAVATGVIDGKKIKRGSITGKQIKARSVPGGDLRPDSVRGKQIREASLGKVPRSRLADSAQFASRAGSATSADRAATAGVAEGLSPAVMAGLKDACPEGTTPYAGACIGSSTHGTATWPVAARACGDAGGRLPHLSELEGFRQLPGVTLDGPEHTDTYLDTNGINPGGQWTIGIWDGGTLTSGLDYGSSAAGYRCVFPLTNE